jgi:hypothetical protein
MPQLQAGGACLNLLLERFAGRIRIACRHFALEEVHPHTTFGAAVVAGI